MASINHKFISYLITDPLFYSSTPEIFQQTLSNSLTKHLVQIACFRDKKSPNFENLAKIFVKTCQNFQIEKILINTNIEIACNLNAHGVHLNSKQFEEIEIAKSRNLFVIISCHTIEEIELAIKLGADYVTFSPIFESPGKSNPIGIEAIKNAKNKIYNAKIIALGGIITSEQIESIISSGADGFASIRYFAD